MTKQQVYEVLSLLNDAYPMFHIDQKKIDNWYRLLKNQDFDIVMSNAERCSLTSKFTPTLSELLQGTVQERSSVPTLDETREYLKKKDEESASALYGDHPERLKRLAEMRKVLGIE